MMQSLQQARAGDVLLLHGCCHNPCGADLTIEQWQRVAELAQQQGLLPFVDVAYQGFGEGIDLDVKGLRLLAERVPEMLIASSCSKNFGLYRDRTGSLTVITQNVAQASIARSQVCNVVRALWSMPPDHGASVVATILSDRELRAQWQGEVAVMRDLINGLRSQLVASLSAAGAGDFAFIARERGMFSFLGLTPAQVDSLRQQFSIYMVDSSRINVAGINPGNIDAVCEAVARVRA
jgi:aspartate aminotransferase